MVTRRELVAYLESLWPENKAKGLLAQLRFKREIRSGGLSGYRRKFFDGCWLLAPKREDFFKFRFCFFVHNHTVDRDMPDEIDVSELINDEWRFHMIAGFLRRAGLGVFYVVALASGGEPIPDDLNWMIYKYADERLHAIDSEDFFGRWPGRGRPSRGRGWDNELRSAYLRVDREDLVSLLLNELFYTGFVKGRMRKPVSDPYDVDGFLLSYSGAVFAY